MEVGFEFDYPHCRGVVTDFEEISTGLFVCVVKMIINDQTKYGRVIFSETSPWGPDNPSPVWTDYNKAVQFSF